jgi:L-seryl-tRNA(Ser) seleniumtransferase
VIHDIGSGAMMDFAHFRLDNEPLAKESITEGTDLVLFSGDKLLGGPQSGIIVGSRSWIGRIKKNPLMRALRVDKMTLAALEATLRLYLAPGMESDMGVPGIPIVEMTATPLKELRRRAEAMAAALQNLEGIGEIKVVPSVAYLGGGSLPEEGIDSIAVRIQPESMTESELAARLRSGHPAVVPRVQDGAVWIEVRTILPAQDASLIDAVRAACHPFETTRSS